MSDKYLNSNWILFVARSGTRGLLSTKDAHTALHKGMYQQQFVTAF